MNRDKIVASFTFAGVLMISALAFALDASEAPRQVLPTVGAVLPEPLPFDVERAIQADRKDPPTIQTTASITIFGEAPKAPGKVWKCGPFRPLVNDATATVRECGWM